MIRELESNRVVVVPTLYGRISSDDIPVDLKGKLYLDFRKQSNYSGNLEKILRLVGKRTSEDLITYHSISWSVRLMDTRGHLAKVTKQKFLTPKAPNVVVIYDRDFSTPGNLRFLGALGGTLSAPIDEGGTHTVATTLSTPLKEGKTSKHELYFEAYDTFLKAKETLSHTVSTEYGDKLAFHVEFPKDRSCRSAKAYYYSGANNAIEIARPKISNRGLKCDLEVKRPKVGKYVLEWEW